MNVRKAVGAIIFWQDKFIIMGRGEIMTPDGQKKIEPEWDLVKGGREENEAPEDSLMRELYEETGSRKFAISRIFEEKLNYSLPSETGFDKQEMLMFLVNYLGDGDDLKFDAKEVVNLGFFTRNEVIQKLKYEETRDFFERHTK